MKNRYSRRDMLTILAGGALSGAGLPRSGYSLPPSSGRVVTARYGGKKRLDIEILGSLLDKSMTAMTGAPNAADAWSSLFSPADHVSIKVNCLGGPSMSTNPMLVRAVTDRLEICGVRRNRIIIWDRKSSELEEAGYELSKRGSAVHCYGTDEAGYGRDLQEKGSVASLFSEILARRCNKVINMPVLKDHGICGITFALKNYFGAINNPNRYHLNHCDPYIADLNTMKLIRERETLIIGDLTRIQADGGPSFKSQWAVEANTILTGRNPVSVDVTALAALEKYRSGLQRRSLRDKGIYPVYIETAARAGIGSIESTETIELDI